MNQTTITKQRGLSDFALKYFAMVCMILDHIHYFFSFTGKIPLFFSWIGRLAAPLFLFFFLYRGGFSSHARPEKIFSAHLRHRRFHGTGAVFLL